MKTLELKPIEKNLEVILVEKEYEEPWDIDYLSTQEESIFRKPTSEFCEILENLVEENDPDFVTDELGMRSEEQFRSGRLANLLENKGIQFESVDMDDYAKPYLANELDEIQDRLMELRKEYSRLYAENPDEKTQKKLDKMLSYGQHLQQKYEEEEDKIAYPLRQKWMAMGVLETAKEIDKEEIKAIHLASPSHFTGMKTLLESLDVEVSPIKLETKVDGLSEEIGTGDITEAIESFDIEMVTASEGGVKREDILFYFDTDEFASPFDICKGSDAGFGLVIPYQNLATEAVADLVQDAIFSRGPEGVKNTSFFLGGSDYQKVREMADIVQESMFPPFQASVVVDPVGANTTGSALVAKVIEGLAEIDAGTLDGKTVSILAGTGPVGRVAAMLCSDEGADVTITSRKEEKAKKIAEEISEECGHEITGVQASNDEEVIEAIKDADIILATGPEGVRIVSKEMLENLEKKPRVIADVNAVPPTGVEDLDSNDDMEEIVDGVYGIGALAVGNVKNQVEMDLLVEARESDQGVFDYNDAYEIVKEKCSPKPKPTTA